jgi:hypothetical protein
MEKQDTCQTQGTDIKVIQPGQLRQAKVKLQLDWNQ